MKDSERNNFHRGAMLPHQSDVHCHSIQYYRIINCISLWILLSNLCTRVSGMQERWYHQLDLQVSHACFGAVNCLQGWVQAIFRLQKWFLISHSVCFLYLLSCSSNVWWTCNEVSRHEDSWWLWAQCWPWCRYHSHTLCVDSQPFQVFQHSHFHLIETSRQVPKQKQGGLFLLPANKGKHTTWWLQDERCRNNGIRSGFSLLVLAKLFVITTLTCFTSLSVLACSKALLVLCIYDSLEKLDREGEELRMCDYNAAESFWKWITFKLWHPTPQLGETNLSLKRDALFGLIMMVRYFGYPSAVTPFWLWVHHFGRHWHGLAARRHSLHCWFATRRWLFRGRPLGRGAWVEVQMQQIGSSLHQIRWTISWICIFHEKSKTFGLQAHC